MPELLWVEQRKHPPESVVRGDGVWQIEKSFQPLGLVYLLEKKYDQAVEQFELSLQSGKKDAQIYNDLGAAHLEKGKSLEAKTSLSESNGESFKAYSKALESFTQAIEVDSSFLEPLFNRALTEQYLDLQPQAKQDWQEYLRKDSVSQWAEEARRKLQSIGENEQQEQQNGSQMIHEFLDNYRMQDDERAWKILCQTRGSNGSLIENKLLDSYLAFLSEGKHQESKDGLKALDYVAKMELQRAGDRYALDLVNFYRQATEEQRIVSALSRKQLRRGFRQFTQTNTDKAINFCSEAKKQFESINNACEARFASFRLAHCLVIQLELEKALPILEQLYSECNEKGYTWLRAQCLSQLAAVSIGSKEYTKAISYTYEALNLSEKAGDANGRARNLLQLADEYRLLNNPAKSLGFLQRALIPINGCRPDLTIRWGIYIVLGLNFNLLSSCKTALEFQKEALRIASILNRPLLIARSYEHMALTCGKLKRYDDAIASFREVSKIADRLSSEDDRLGLIARSNLLLGQLFNEAAQYGRAIEAYDRSIETYNKIRFQQHLYAAHKGRLLACIAQKDDQAIDTEIQKVFSLFEEYRTKISTENHRNSFFDAEQQVYDVAINFEYAKRGNYQQAFNYSEVCKARSFLDSMRVGASVFGKEQGFDLSLPSVSNALTLPDLQQLLPDNVQILQYAVLEDTTIAWVVTQSGIVGSAELKTGLKGFGEKASDFQKLVSSPSESKQDRASQQARELYEILIKPVESYLDKSKESICSEKKAILSGRSRKRSPRILDG